MIRRLFPSFLQWVLPAVVFALAATQVRGVPTDLSGLSSDALEERHDEIEEELAGLANLMMRTGLGSQGFRSRLLKEGETISVQIDLGGKRKIDQVVLVPSIWRVGEASYQADGFPEEFRLVVGSGDEDGIEVAAFTKDDELLPRSAPVVIDCPGTQGEWVRLEAKAPSPSFWSDARILQLSEIMVFEGGVNVALGQSVTTSTPAVRSERASSSLLVDGQVPYLMDARDGSSSVAFVSEVGIAKGAKMEIDLGESLEVDGVSLHRVDLGDTVPQSTVSDFGLPRRMVVEGATTRGFEDVIRLGEIRVKSVYEAGPILPLVFQSAKIRYLRMRIVEPYSRKPGEVKEGAFQFGAAEVEILSKGENVALGKTFTAEFDGWGDSRKIEALTDGRNLYGTILGQRGWLGQLARRHDLEILLPKVNGQLDQRYSLQKHSLRILFWVVAGLLITIVIAVVGGRIRRLNELSALKERLAADLHDELGANLHTIGLLSDLATKATEEKRDSLPTLMRRIRSETERSGEAVRRCSRLLLSDEVYSGLVADMERSARRIAGEVEHTLEVIDKVGLEQLPGPYLHDLYLFHKECLVNVGRHSEATIFKTLLRAEGRNLLLKVEDNGRGFPLGQEDLVPPSLERRAKLLRGKIVASGEGNKGVSIELQIKLPKLKT